MVKAIERTLGRRILLYALYPLLLFVPIFGAIYWLGQVGEAQYPLIITVVSLGMAVLLFALEYVIPEHKEWHPSGKVMFHDLLHMVITSVVPTELFKAVLLSLAVWAAPHISIAGFQAWPSHWPLVLQMLLAIHLGDMGYYILHRALHEVPKIWPFHAVHHSPEQLYVIASNRAHPIQIFFTYGIQVGILYAMGISQEALLMFSVFVSVNGQLQHCNVNMRCGILNWIFATPDLHRWHHSIEIPESNSNYGNNVVLWDLLFGTRFLPREVGIGHDHIGLPPGTDFPETFWGQVMAPFRWEKIRYDRDK